MKGLGKQGKERGRKKWTGLKMEGRDRATVEDIGNERNQFQSSRAHEDQLALPVVTEEDQQKLFIENLCHPAWLFSGNWS